jgi:hypothetical protein
MSTYKVHFVLHISAHEYQDYYSGTARNVAVTARDGRAIKFPANILRPFISHDGIHGEFVIEFDDNNKFVAINKL